MNHANLVRVGIAGLVLALLGLRSASVLSDPTFTAGAAPTIAQDPLYMRDAVPPLNMLVMGKDHKIYYEAYNDASDLDGDGILDVGYRGWELKSPVPDEGSPFKIDYYGYFNSFACYAWDGSKFVPASASSDKTCSGSWSGDFLNYATMSRMDALRRVLYGGWRQVDTATETVLQGAFFPQDAHSWGKEYESQARDGYDIRDYTPLQLPASGRRHLFAVTTVTGHGATFPNYEAPLFRVLTDSTYRVWEWVSIEGPVANRRCEHGQSGPFCENSGAEQPFPGHPGSRSVFDNLESTYAIADNLFGTSSLDRIDCNSADCNPHGADDNYLSIITGQLRIRSGRGGTYQFRIDGDDAIDFELRNSAGTTVVASAGCYNARGFGGACTGSTTSAQVTLNPGLYSLKFRHEEATGGDGYRLEWRKTGGGNNFGYEVLRLNGGNRHDSNGGLESNVSASFYDLTPSTGASDMTDYAVRVRACPSDAALRDATCKTYPGGSHKPTGILHDYGETQRMYFGLITGSQRNNLEGGQLRRNISNFAEEIDAESGVFLANVDGIARSIDRLRMIGGGYASGSNNLNSDSNWGWGNGNGNCPAVGDRAIVNGECRMWGNPIAEMLYEGLRYFAGASGPTPRFSTTGGSTAGNEDATLGLPTPEWRDPYGTSGTGLSYPACAKPYQTIISDINPSYDGDLPGSGFAGAETGTGDTPALISGFHAANQGQAIWNAEFGAGARNVFIGEVGGVTNNAPTAKSASSFGNIRGLSPEEPSKGGTYYSASVARFGRTNDVNAAPDGQAISTYSIALASPLPRIEFPVGGRTVTLLPFAKTVSGTFGGGTRKPTNTIVDFYVEGFANFPAQIAAGEQDTSVNGGRPQAVFRINYEDVEQGNDHDMDVIVRYQVSANADNTVRVALDAEYAAGSANQNVGYVISGTTKDGIYLEVRDPDSTQANSVYELNTPTTPAVRWAGECVGATTTSPCNQGLGLTSVRTFALGTTGGGTQLENPLWFAAKYGSPTPELWDEDEDGDPDNYFLVSNPLNLRTQLSKAFDDIEDRDLDVGGSTVSGARVSTGSFTIAPSFARNRDGKDWTGNITAFPVYDDGTLDEVGIWTAQGEMPAHDLRNIRTVIDARTATFDAVEFRNTAAFGATPNDRLGRLGINPVNINSLYGASYGPGDFIAYLRGDQTREADADATASDTLRQRSSVLGDIVNSEPVVFSPRSDFGYGFYSDSMFSGYADTGTSGYLRTKRDKTPVVYVGANDGMLHAFDASSEECTAPDGRTRACATTGSGEELFGFIPNAVLNTMGALALPDEHFDHRYRVDGQIAIGDAKDGGTWKTLLAASTGGGARSVFALDVTDIESRSSFADNDILWERNSQADADIGHVYGKPLIVPLENGEWAVLFGNGYGGQLSDPSLYILDAFDGSVIKKITANDGHPAQTSTNPIADWICNLTGLLCARKTDPFNGLGQITAIDRNGNGKVDTVYGGDLQGNLWKFDLRGSTVSAWDVYNFPSAGRVPVFTAETDGERQPITGGLRVSAGPGQGVMVYFGTGRYFVEGDNEVDDEPQVQALYGVFDNGPVSGTTGATPAGDRDALIGQTITEEVVEDYTVRNISRNRARYFGAGAVRGWYLDLKLDAAADGNGERFIATPRIQSGRVFFTTYVPDPNGTGCAPGGVNWQYGLDLLSGAGALTNIALQDGTVACEGTDCGAIAIRNPDGGTTMPPITNTGMLAIRPTVPVDFPACDPAVEDCPTFEQCQVVIYPGAFVLPRPCGRQSWRQLK